MTSLRTPPVVAMVCPLCNSRCGLESHWPEHVVRSCARKIRHETVADALDHTADLWYRRHGRAYVYECPIGPEVHWHVARGRPG